MQNLDLQRKLEKVYQESLLLKKKREKKQLKKQRKIDAQKLPLRNTIDLTLSVFFSLFRKGLRQKNEGVLPLFCCTLLN